MKNKSFLIILSVAFSVFAFSILEPRPYVSSAPLGLFYLKMVPLDNNYENGELTVYHVTSSRDDSIFYKINGWYANQAFISTFGDIIVRINYPRHNTLSEAASEIMIGFYKKGKKIRTYEAGNLIKNPNLAENPFHGGKWYSFIKKVIGFNNEKCEEFEIITSDNETIVFNPRNGDILRRIQNN